MRDIPFTAAAEKGRVLSGLGLTGIRLARAKADLADNMACQGGELSLWLKADAEIAEALGS